MTRTRRRRSSSWVTAGSVPSSGRATSTAEHRESVLRELLDEHGLSPSAPDVSHGPVRRRHRLPGRLELLDLDEPPTVIVCGNDVVAFGALNAAARAGCRVPDDVSIVGFDDLPAARWPLVELTTVAFDLDAMMREPPAWSSSSSTIPERPFRARACFDQPRPPADPRCAPAVAPRPTYGPRSGRAQCIRIH